jgi:hypothetical protein
MMVAAVILCAITSSAFAQAGDQEALKIELPKPMFVGTPKPIDSPNLEIYTGKTRDPFMAPKGCVNLAKGKEVKASDNEPIIGEATMITDGDKEGSDGSFVEFGPDLQNVTIDLGQMSEIYAIVVWHFHSQARVYKDVVVKTAEDADFIKGVQTVYNNDHDNTAALGLGEDKEYIETFEGRLMGVKGVKGRFVRLFSKGNTTNDMNHYTEVEVWGKPVAK